MNYSRKPRFRNRKAILIAIVFLVATVGIYFLTQLNLLRTADKFTAENSISSDRESIRIRTNVTKQVRQVIIPKYNITFDVPNKLYTGQELRSKIQDSNNAQTIIRLYKKDTKYSKDNNGYDVADNTIIFSFDEPYGVDPIYGVGEFISGSNAPAPSSRTSFTDNLSFDGSVFQKRAVDFYSFMDNDHKRFDDKYTNLFKGNVRMDLSTGDHINPTIGVVYSCYDQSEGDSDLCQKTFQEFISSLRLQTGALNDPPPTYNEDDVFGLIPIKKRNFDPQQKIYAAGVYNPKNTIPYYQFSKAQDLLSLEDNNLRNMQCLPDQIYYRGNNVFELLLQPIGRSVSVKLTDSNLLKIVSVLKANISEGYTLSQFIACKTDDNKYVVKYNKILQQKQNFGVGYDDIAYAQIALISPDWRMQNIVSIANKSAYCNHFLALTQDNTLYFECTFQQPDKNNRGNNIYKINLSKKNYSLISTCNFPLYGEERNPPTYCY